MRYLLILPILCFSGCFGVRVVSQETMQRICVASLDIKEGAKAIDLGAPLEIVLPDIIKGAETIADLTGEPHE